MNPVGGQEPTGISLKEVAQVDIPVRSQTKHWLPVVRLCVLALICGNVGCSKHPSREALIQQLVTRGDKLLAAGKQGYASDAYWLASVYAPEDPDLAGKLARGRDATDRSSLVAGSEAGERCSTFAESLAIDPENWSETTPAMDQIELQMLADESLVGSSDHALETLELSFVSFQFHCFIGKPQTTVESVISTYGKPANETTSPAGVRTLTYGRIRILAAEDGNVALVLFRPLEVADNATEGDL